MGRQRFVASVLGLAVYLAANVSLANENQNNVASYEVSMRVQLDLSRLDPAATHAQVTCQLSSREGIDTGAERVPLFNNAYSGPIDVVINATQPLISYDDAQCDLSLCRDASNQWLCDAPKDHHQITGPNTQYLAFDSDQAHRLQTAQALHELVVLEIEPVASPLTVESQTHSRSAAQPKTLKDQKATPATVTVASFPSKKKSAAKDENVALAIEEQRSAAREEFMANGFDEKAAELAVSDSKKAAELISLRVSGAQLGGDQDDLEAATAEYVKGKGSEEAKRRASMILLARSGAVDANEKELMDSKLTARELLGVKAAAASMGLDEEKYVDEAVKEGDTKGALISVAADAVDVDADIAKGFSSGRDILQAAAFIDSNGGDRELLNDPKVAKTFQDRLSGKLNEVDFVRKMHGFGVVGDNVLDHVEGKGAKGKGKGKKDAPKKDQRQNSRSNPNASRDTDTFTSPQGSGHGDDRTGGMGVNAADQANANAPVYEIESRGTNENGNETVTWSVTGTDGQDGTYTTEYFPDGTYMVFEGEGIDGRIVGEGEGTPPNEDVQAGDTTATVDGDEALFRSDKQPEKKEEKTGDEKGDGNGSESGNGEGDDDGNKGSCNEEGGDCSSEEESTTEEQAAETDEKTSEEGTPDPRDRDNMSEGVAWAMQNPDNPMAQQILKTAAKSVEDLSGTCQTGCPDATRDGGILWAMNNPDNPLAQQILADTADAISDNSGDGQKGGADDNPANEPINTQASENDLRRIELLIAGGGLVDPPEEGGGSTGDPEGPLGGGAPITGGNPAADGITKDTGFSADGFKAQGDGFGGGLNPDDPENPDDEISVDTNQIQSGGIR